MSRLEVIELRKSYGNTRVVDGVSFTVEAGEIFGLLGPNGAGKTTTMSMIAGLLKADSGEVRFDGRPLKSLDDFWGSLRKTWRFIRNFQRERTSNSSASCTASAARL